MAAATSVPSFQQRKLDKVLSHLQENANVYTSSGRIEVCRGLHDLELQPDVWQIQYSEFREVVEDNRLCAWNVYEAFRNAVNVFPMKTIETTGFWASLRLGTIEDQSLRSMIVREIRRWQLLEGLFTSYQAVDVWLRAKYPDQFPTIENKRDHIIEKLRKEIKNLSMAYARVVTDNQKLKADLVEARHGR